MQNDKLSETILLHEDNQVYKLNDSMYEGNLSEFFTFSYGNMRNSPRQPSCILPHRYQFNLRKVVRKCMKSLRI